MNKKALERSINKYQKTVNEFKKNLGCYIEYIKYNYYIKNYRIPIGAKDCPLCKLYFYEDCEGCNIKKDTGFIGCKCTPYWKYYNELFKSKKITKRLLNVTIKELEYLKYLYERQYAK